MGAAAEVVTLVVGLALLAVAADALVLGAARIALLTRVPALVVGVVIVGFGTSSPEMLVSTLAAIDDRPEVAIGNVIGSNLANLTLLLGLGAVLVPITVTSRVVRREAPAVLVAAVAMAVALRGGGLSRLDGAVLLALMGATGVLLLRLARRDSLEADVTDFALPAEHRMAVEVVRTSLGLVGTIAGAQLLLTSALDLADRFDLAAGFIGVTLVALGTSLPELVTVIQSARRKETDLLVGNLLGSNLFNSLAVTGLVGLVGPRSLRAGELSPIASLAVVAISALTLLAMWTGHRVTKVEGALLMAAYGSVLFLL